MSVAIEYILSFGKAIVISLLLAHIYIGMSSTLLVLELPVAALLQPLPTTRFLPL